LPLTSRRFIFVLSFSEEEIDMADMERRENFVRPVLAGPALSDNRELKERLVRFVLGISSVTIFMTGLVHPDFQGLFLMGVGLLLFARVLRIALNAANPNPSSEKLKVKSEAGKEDLTEDLHAMPCTGKISSAPCFLLLEQWSGGGSHRKS
jgi:hypothetical protein